MHGQSQEFFKKKHLFRFSLNIFCKLALQKRCLAMSICTINTENPAALRLPFPLPVIQAKDDKKKCCKKFKKGKRCKKCPGAKKR